MLGSDLNSRRFSNPPPSKIVLTDEILVQQPAIPRTSTAAALGVEEKQVKAQFAFFLRCRIGNDGQ
jgi:hypothetical protein